MDSFRDNCQVEMIYMDFSKAFDSVDYILFLQTLDTLGIDSLFSSLRSYLTNRFQWVNILSTSSNPFTPISDVPQGAVLSPLMFALFVNSVVSVLNHVKLLVFIDDMSFLSYPIYLRL